MFNVFGDYDPTLLTCQFCNFRIRQTRLVVIVDYVFQVVEAVSLGKVIFTGNHFIQQQGFSREKVIGSGGQLDSSRLRIVLGHPEKEVEAYVLGEHGEDQVPILSRVKINGIQQSYSATEKENIRQKIKETAIMVIQKKGATVFAPASNTADMVEAILKDQHKLMICSANLQGEYRLEKISLGVPVILGKNGIEKIEEWNLEEEELSQLQEAGRKLKEMYATLIPKP